jgi:DNA sulfur modification protein DndD
LNAFKIEKTGALGVLKAPVTFIDSVIPAEMARYFFFDGESAESFSSATNFQAIGQAIRNILGVTLADGAISDLKELKKVIDREIGQIQGQKELSNIEQRLSTLTERLEEAVEFKKNFKTDIATYKAQRDQIYNELRSLEGSREIQLRRDEKLRQLRQLEEEITTTQAEIVKWIGQKALSLVSHKLTKETLDFVDEASLKGKIPSPYNEEFVQGLIDDEHCICGRELHPGSEEWRLVANLLKKASNAEILGRVVRARSRINVLKNEAADAPKVLESLQRRLSSLTNARNEAEQIVAELGQKIQSLPLAEIAEKEKAGIELDRKISAEDQNLGKMKAAIQKIEHDKAQAEKELALAVRTNKRAQKLFNKRTLLENAAAFLKAVLGQYEHEARHTIESRINEILARVAHRDYKCRINSNFSIELTYADGRSTPKSSGENQLLSLVFIAALVEFASSRANSEDPILKPGTIAPLVLDSPFGQLDTSYQESTASWIPQLAQQVVLLVSSSQGNEKVLSALAPYVGAEYILISENRSPKEPQKGNTKLVVGGREYSTSLYMQPRNLTRIVRVE